jgi:hypothetical protein
MTRACADCLHSILADVQGRDRLGCGRYGKTRDGKVMTPPRGGWECVGERMAVSDLDWRVDRCGPDGRNFQQREAIA